jgi:hypothetical protein
MLRDQGAVAFSKRERNCMNYSLHSTYLLSEQHSQTPRKIGFTGSEEKQWFQTSPSAQEDQAHPRPSGSEIISIRAPTGAGAGIAISLFVNSAPTEND